jgi:hypothetical protein
MKIPMRNLVRTRRFPLNLSTFPRRTCISSTSLLGAFTLRKVDARFAPGLHEKVLYIGVRVRNLLILRARGPTLKMCFNE